jgi:hypothetical protein
MSGDHGKTEAAGTGIKIFGVLAARFGLIVAVDDLDGANDEDFPALPGQKNASPARKGISAGRLRPPLRGCPMDRPSIAAFLSAARRLVGDTQLVSN